MEYLPPGWLFNELWFTEVWEKSTGWSSSSSSVVVAVPSCWRRENSNLNFWIFFGGKIQILKTSCLPVPRNQCFHPCNHLWNYYWKFGKFPWWLAMVLHWKKAGKFKFLKWWCDSKGPIIYFIEGRSPSRHKQRFCI